ncbi:MAG: permease [Halanaerobium sp.]|nr:permease [Halanaerobium sp.]
MVAIKTSEARCKDCYKCIRHCPVKAIGLKDGQARVVALENALVAPFVAAMTFIGSMGDIPLATVLNANGVLFAVIMGFIYSDLMVPPLVAVNARYYGKRVAFYIAGIMYVSIVLTALLLNGVFSSLGILPQSSKVISEVTRFKIDYTFYFNIIFILLAGWQVYLKKQFAKIHEMVTREMAGKTRMKRLTAYAFLLTLLLGLLINLLGY